MIFMGLSARPVFRFCLTIHQTSVPTTMINQISPAEASPRNKRQSTSQPVPFN